MRTVTRPALAAASTAAIGLALALGVPAANAQDRGVPDDSGPLGSIGAT